MALYVAQARGNGEADLERATFVRDGFSWPALVFGPFWLLAHRLWAAAALWIVVEAAFVWFVLPHVEPGAAALLDGLAHCFLGFEGHRLLIAKAARGADVIDVVEGRDREEAETRFYRRHVPPPLPPAPEANPFLEPNP